MFKKRISLLLVLMMVLSMMMPTFAFGATNDYADHWAKDTIQTWLDKEYISGYGDGIFRPDGQVTRSEFVKMVNNAFGYTETADITFTDVKAGEWYYEEVQKAVKAGYISGYSDTQFAPQDKLTREQAALIIAKIKALEGNTVKADAFTDADKMADWSKASIGAVAEAGYMKGYENGSFGPANSITRAEAVVTLDRAITSTEVFVVDKSGTTLQDQEFENILIDAKVGSGTVTLKNVTVTGELLVEGGGENSIILENCTINTLTTNKADGKVRVLATGTTVVNNTVVKLGATLESKDLTGKGFEKVVVAENVKSGQTLIVKANVADLTVNSKITLNVKSGIISNLTIEKAAEGSRIILAKGVVVTEATVNAKVAFEGTGTVDHATINADGVVFEKLPTKFDVADGIKAPKQVTPPSGGGGGGGNSGTTEKNLIVDESTTTDALTNQVYDNVTVSEGVKDVTFNNVTINKSLVINGGASNSLHFSNCNIIGTTLIDALTNPHISAEGTTTFVGELTAKSKAIISGTTNATFGKIVAQSAGTAINNVTADNITVDRSAATVTGSAVTISGGKIKTVDANAQTSINGGTVATLNATQSVSVDNAKVIQITVTATSDGVKILLGTGTTVNTVTIAAGSTKQPELALDKAKVDTVSSVADSGVKVSGEGTIDKIETIKEGNVELPTDGGITDNNGNPPAIEVVSAFVTNDVILEPKSVNVGTAFKDLPLDKEVTVTLTNGKTQKVAVDWNDSSTLYDAAKPGVYNLTGNFVLSGTDISSAGYKAKITITVKEVKVEKITVNPTSAALVVGADTTLKATVTPTNATNKDVVWTSGDVKIATVDASTGFVKAVAVGTATITATAKDGSGVTGTCVVTVSAVPAGKVIVSFNSNGGSPVDSITLDKDSAIGALPTTTRDGYTFDGWFTADGTAFTATTTVTESLTVSAKWTEVPTDKLTVSPGALTIKVTKTGAFTANKAITAISSADTAIATVVTSSAMGATVTGVAKGTTTITVTAGTETATVTVTVTDVPPVPKKVTVTFNNGTTTAAVEVTEGVVFGDNFPTDPTRDGYTFDGWFTAATEGTKFTATTVVNADITVYAQWTEVPTDKLTVSPGALTIEVSKSGTFTANKAITAISSADTAIATVVTSSAMGATVTGVAKGTTTITVTAGTETATVAVTVTDTDVPPVTKTVSITTTSTAIVSNVATSAAISVKTAGITSGASLSGVFYADNTTSTAIDVTGVSIKDKTIILDANGVGTVTIERSKDAQAEDKTYYLEIIIDGTTSSTRIAVKVEKDTE